MDGNLRTCWRCGVDFDPTPYIDDAPCPDCQMDFEGHFFSVWTPEGIAAAKEYDVRRHAAAGMTDREIAKKVGSNRNSIWKIRHQHDIPANATGGAQHWKDYDTTVKKLRSPEHAQKIIEGQRKANENHDNRTSRSPVWPLY